MKHLYILFFLFFNFTVIAQPTGYYDYATGTGYTLKTQLKKIIDDIDDPEIVGSNEHIESVQTYNALDNFNSTYELDNYYEMGSNTILDIYSENPSGTDPYNFTPTTDECGNYSAEGDCYNKEHLIPQSVFSSQPPMYSDAHHLFPTDGRVNGFRGNYPYGVVDNNQLVSQSGISNPTLNGSKLGNNLNSGYSAGYTGIVFEPIDEFKGDIARVYFYFATRYEDQISSWSGYDMFDGSSDKVFNNTFLSILLTWHQNDPVSQKEIDRNNNIYYNHQNNRNPFVDHPEYVGLIWSLSSDAENPTDPSNLIASNPTDNTIDLNWTASTDNVSVIGYDIYVDNVYDVTTSNTSYTVSSLTANTNYCFTVKAKDAAGNESGFSNQACEMTSNNGSSGTADIFFSEYIEGSSNNKALEIANFTGSNITDLSIYTLKLSTNGSATWGSPYTFPIGAQISNGDVYVIANGGSTICTSVYDNLNNAITSFNGNDAIGLFKNDELIDILGDFNSSADYAKDVTLVRKPTVEFPTTTFDINEWNLYSTNTCDDLGTHTQTLSSKSFNTKNFKIYPNPTNGNFLNIETHETLTVEIYDILGKKVMESAVNSENRKIQTGSLNKGIYLLRLISEHGSITRKLIKN